MRLHGGWSYCHHLHSVKQHEDTKQCKTQVGNHSLDHPGAVKSVLDSVDVPPIFFLQIEFVFI